MNASHNIEKILITGISGFIGSELSRHLLSSGNYSVIGSSRSERTSTEDEGVIRVEGLSDKTDWSEALSQVDVVVHTAARAHILKDRSDDPLKEFFKINVDGTINLAKQAADSGVRRFIYLSSIGVNGIQTKESSFNELITEDPRADYAKSKYEAEIRLKQLAMKANMEIVIIRPPLVYGVRAPGNFGLLMKIVSKGIPLPFSLVKNQRSLVSIDNLVDFIAICVDHKHAANEIFVISDDEDVSTPQLIVYLSTGMGMKAHLFPVPLIMLKLISKIFGQESKFIQLCGSLSVDVSKAKKLLNWKPKFTASESLIQMAECYREKNH